MPQYPTVGLKAKQHGQSKPPVQRLERPPQPKENTRGLVQRIEVRT